MVVPPRNPACKEFRSGTFVFLQLLLLALALLHRLRLSFLHHLLEHSKNQGSRKTNTGNPLITFGR